VILQPFNSPPAGGSLASLRPAVPRSTGPPRNFIRPPKLQPIERGRSVVTGPMTLSPPTAPPTTGQLYAVATEAMRAYAGGHGYGTIEFADLSMADPRQDPEAGTKGRHLRRNLNRTRRRGVTVREYRGETSPDAGLEAQSAEVLELPLAQPGSHGLETDLRSARTGRSRLAGKFGTIEGTRGNRCILPSGAREGSSTRVRPKN
jgi:hypothetical protein